MSTGTCLEGRPLISLIHPLLAFLTTLTHQDLAQRVVFLREDNRVLRSQLPKRMVVAQAERGRLLKLG